MLEEYQKLFKVVQKINEGFYHHYNQNGIEIIPPLTLDCDGYDYNISLMGGHILWRSLDDERPYLYKGPGIPLLDEEGEHIKQDLEGHLNDCLTTVGKFLLLIDDTTDKYIFKGSV